MNNYEKPVVQVNESAAEGVYAASGVSPYAYLCGSPTMKGIYRMGNWKDGATYEEYYGCAACPNSARNGVAGCALSNGEYAKVLSQNGEITPYHDQKPRWERDGYAKDAVVTVTYLGS